jgi:SAM-dependent methyltransferase
LLNDDPYERIAGAYDAEFDHAEADIADFGRRLSGRRVLVVGCGTGRVNRALASLADVTGIDRSTPMIERARVRGPRQLRYEVADMCDFDLGEFDDLIVPNASFAFLPDRAARAAALACFRHACPRGVITLDLPAPDNSLLSTAHTAEKPAWEGRVNGELWRRTRESWRFPLEQTLILLDRYYGPEAGPPLRSELRLHMFWPDEIEWMLEANGLYAESVEGGHQGQRVRDGCDRLYVRARVA